jgi:hypothetical protein
VKDAGRLSHLIVSVSDEESCFQASVSTRKLGKSFLQHYDREVLLLSSTKANIVDPKSSVIVFISEKMVHGICGVQIISTMSNQ